MTKIARSLRQHRELILKYFRAGKLVSSHHEKITRIPHLPRAGTGALSLTWETTWAGIHPRFLLTIQKKKGGAKTCRRLPF
jgi:hypothetical protein